MKLCNLVNSQPFVPNFQWSGPIERGITQGGKKERKKESEIDEF